ncbi:putative reverse transcriptase domain-containing protein [Tanacetum coccineum]
MAPVTRRGPNTPPNNTNPNNMTPESVQAMIDQALLRNSTNRDGSHRNEGVVGLTRWIEKMESVFNISGCAIENQVKFATCTLLGAALTWWNGQIRTLGPDAYSMTWEVLKKKMTNKYCPQGEIKKLEIELWNLKVKGNDVPTYTERFQELTLICTKFVANEMQTDNKRKADDSSRNNHGHQQQPFKRQNVTKGHLPATAKGSVQRNCCYALEGTQWQFKGNGYFECGAPGRFKRDCPKLKNKDGEMGMHKAGYTQLEMQRRMGMHRGTRTLMSSRFRRYYRHGLVKKVSRRDRV